MKPNVNNRASGAATRVALGSERKNAGPPRERRAPRVARWLWIAAAVCATLIALTWPRTKGSSPVHPDSPSTDRAGAVSNRPQTHDPPPARSGGAQPETTPPAPEEILIN